MEDGDIDDDDKIAKGLQLEVGDWRAPRLLVYVYFGWPLLEPGKIGSGI